MKGKAQIFKAVIVSAMFSFMTSVSAFSEAQKVICKIEMDRSVLPSDSAQRAVVKVTLVAPKTVKGDNEKIPANLAIVIDSSDSMQGEKLEKTKEYATQLIKKLSREDRFSVVNYGDSAETVIPNRQAQITDKEVRQIQQIKGGGNAALFAGLNQGATEVRKNLSENYVNRIILLSDGIANVGPNGANDLGRIGVSFAKEGITVTTIGIGTEYNEELMAKLSQGGDGNSYFVKTVDELPAVLESELVDITSVTAKDVKLEIKFNNGIKPVRVIGRTGAIENGIVKIAFKQLYSNQEKYVLIESDIEPHADKQVFKAVLAKAVYKDTLTSRLQESDNSMDIQFSSSIKDVDASVNGVVQREYNINLYAEEQQAALDYVKSGEKEKASKVMKTSSVRLKDAGEKLNDEVLIDNSVKAQQAAEQVDDGFSAEKRKEMQIESYKTINQQKSK